MPVSDHFLKIPVSQITIPPRMRQEFTSSDHTKLYSLELSIRKYGLISPIIITRDLELVAGHRRLLCHLRLNLPTIKAFYADTLNPAELLSIELEENLRRLRMTWRETMLGVGRYHTNMQELNPKWTGKDTSISLGIPGKTVTDFLLIFPFRNHQEILSATGAKPATTIARRLLKEEIQKELKTARVILTLA